MAGRRRITDEMKQRWWDLYYGSPSTPISAIASRFGVHRVTIETYFRDRRLTEPMPKPVTDGVGTIQAQLVGKFTDRFLETGSKKRNRV